MSVHVVAMPKGLPSQAFLDAVTTVVRTDLNYTFADGGYTITFVPDLTVQEIAALDDCVAATRSATGLSVADYQAVRAQMQTLRAMRQLGRNAYVNLTEAERNRQTYDVMVACCEIFLKLTRET